MNAAISYALGSATCFSLGSLFYKHYANKISPKWINAFKSMICLVWLLLYMAIFFRGETPPIGVCLSLAASGLLGLMIGDYFLMDAFGKLGTARTLMLFGFSPLLLGLSGFFLFGQALSLFQGGAILSLLACSYVFSRESFKKEGHWNLLGLAAAMVAVVLDAGGVLLTRYAFEVTTMDPFHANFFRVAAACIGFSLHFSIAGIAFWAPLKTLSRRSLLIVSVGCTIGTFVSLGFWLKAISIGPLAVVSSVGGTAPIMAALFESLWERKRPTKYLYTALVFFAVGFGLLQLHSHYYPQ